VVSAPLNHRVDSRCLSGVEYGGFGSAQPPGGFPLPERS